MAARIRVSIAGSSGYTGGELLRLLLAHPGVELAQVTSESNRGKYVTSTHPNLRKRTDLQYSSMEDLSGCDLLFLCLPHGGAIDKIERFQSIAPRIIDLSADYRLRDPADYPKWYGYEHRTPDLLAGAVYGIPELHREQIRRASLVSGAGCNATATILGLMPLCKHGLVEPDPVVVEVKVGSSEAGRESTPGSHHPERSGAVRSFEPTGHRHTAEILQELNFGQALQVHFSGTSIDMVRGVLATVHCFLKENLNEKDIWKIYRQEYSQEPFIRIIKEKTGIYRFPEPKILVGSNYCDIGFEKDSHSKRLVVLSAIDNLMKGAAGNGVQAMNVMYGFEETAGLAFPGLHPI